MNHTASIRTTYVTGALAMAAIDKVISTPSGKVQLTTLSEADSIMRNPMHEKIAFSEPPRFRIFKSLLDRLISVPDTTPSTQKIKSREISCVNRGATAYAASNPASDNHCKPRLGTLNSR